MNEEDQETIDHIAAMRAAERAQEPAGESSTSPASPKDTDATDRTAHENSIREIIELTRKDERDSLQIEKAKLDFAASSAFAIALFGVLMIAAVAWLGFKRILHPSKLIALGMIVTAALLLIVLGYTDDQMSPVIGLLGTVAGYMLGSKEWDRNDASATIAADAQAASANRAAQAADAAAAGGSSSPSP